MLTGAVTAFKVRALTKATVYEIDKEDIAPILKESPAMAAELSQIMLRREAAGKARLDELAPGDEHAVNLSGRITGRVRALLGLT